jgi:hypothetical protein
MAKLPTKPAFGPSAETFQAISDAETVSRLRQAGLAYESKVKDLSGKFDMAMSQLRSEYLAEISAIHGGGDAES